MRRVALKVALSLAAAAALAACLVALAHTSHGFAVLKRLVLPAVNRVLVGRLEVGELEGFLGRRFALTDVELTDATGEAAISAERITVDYSLPSLVLGRVVVHELRVESPTVELRQTPKGLNLAHLVSSDGAPRQASEEEAVRAPFPISVDRVVLMSGAYAMSAFAADDVRIEGSFSFEGDQLYARVDHASARFLRPTPGPASVEGVYRLDAGEHVLEHVRASLGEAQVEGSLAFTSITRDAQGRVRGALPEGFVGAWVGRPELIAEVQLEASSRAADRGMDLRFSLDLGPGGRVRGRALGPLEEGFEFEVRVDRGRPWRIDTAGPELTTSLVARGDGALAPVSFEGTLTGTTAVHAPVPAAGSFEAEAFTRPGRSGFDADIRVGEARAQVGMTVEEGALTEADGRWEIPELRALPLDTVDALAALSGATQGRFSYDADGWATRLSAEGLEWRGLSTRKLRLEGFGAPGRPRDVEATASAEGLVFDGRALGDWTVRTSPEPRDLLRVDLKAGGDGLVRSVELSGITALRLPSRTLFDAGHVDTSSASWSLAPWELSVSEEELRVQSFDARSKKSRIRIDGRVDSRNLSGAGSFTVDLDDIGELSFALPSIRGGRALVEGEGTWSERQRSVDVKAQLTEVRVRGAPAFDASLEARARTSTASLTAQMELGPRGGASVRAKLDLPPFGEDVVTSRLVRSLDLEVVRVNLGLFAELEGQMSGALDYQRDAQSLRGRFDVDGLDHVTAREPMNGTLTLSGSEAETRGTLKLPFLELAARSARPPSAILDGDIGDVSIELTSGEMTVPRVAELFTLPPPFDDPVGGRVRLVGTATRSANGWSGDLDLDADKVELTPETPQLSVRLKGTMTDGAWRGQALVRGDGFGEASSTASSSVAPWVRVAPDQGFVSVKDLRISGLRSLTTLPLVRAGAISGRATWREGGARGRADVDLTEAIVGRGVVPLSAHIGLELEPTRVESEVSISGQGEPFARAVVTLPRDAQGGVDRSAPATGRLEELSVPLERLFPETDAEFEGLLQGSGSFGGALSNPDAKLSLELLRGNVGGTRFDTFVVAGGFGAGGLTVTATLAESSGGTLDAHVEVDEKAVDASIVAEDMDLGFLTAPTVLALGPVAAVRGRLSGQLEASGALTDPRAQGAFAVTSLSVLAPQSLPPIEDGRLEVEFDDARFEASLVGRTPPTGQLSVEAQGGFSEEGRFEASAKMKGREVRALAGPLIMNVTTSADAELEDLGSTLEVRVVVHETSVRLPDESGASFHPVAPPEDVVRVETFGVRPQPQPRPVSPSPGATPPYLIEIGNDGPINIRGRQIQGAAGFELSVDIFPEQVRTRGRADLRSGLVEVFGRQYSVEKAEVVLTGATPPNPRLDIELSHPFRSLTLRVFVTGTVNDPDVRFTSSPSTYDQAQLLAFFTGLSNPGQTGRSSSPQASAAGLLLGPIAEELSQSLPIDTLNVATKGTAAVITVGKWLSETVFVAAGYDGTREGANAYEGTLRWRFVPGWLLEVAASLESQSADILWTKRF